MYSRHFVTVAENLQARRRLRLSSELCVLPKSDEKAHSTEGAIFYAVRKVDNLLIRIGNPTMENPCFINAVAIRFVIGGETPVYSDASLLRDTVVNPQYIGASLQRAKAIYSSLPQPPNLLRIDTHPNEDGPVYGNGLDLSVLQNLVSLPHEQREQQINDGDEQYMVLQLYWDLCKIDFSPELLLREIIKADLGGISSLVQAFIFANTDEVYCIIFTMIGAQI